MPRKTRPATLKVAYRPRLAQYVVTHRGRVVCRSREYDGTQAFIAGWRESEANPEASLAKQEALLAELLAEHATITRALQAA